MTGPFVLAAVLAAAQADSLAPRLIDNFERVAGWTAHPADGVTLTLRSDAGHRGRAMRLDFAFAGGGYAIARKALALNLPPNYAFSFWIRGEAAPNTLEFKLIDRSGENVWWYTERDVAFDGLWRRISIRRRQIAFAWGPAGGGELRRAAALEFVITAGAGGGSGSVWLDDLTLAPLPVPSGESRPPTARGAGAPGHAADLATDGNLGTSWRPPRAGAAALTLDLGGLREFGGLTFEWEPGRAAADFDVLFSSDGRAWRTVHRATGSDSGRDDLYLPDSEARFVRLLLHRAEGQVGFGLREAVIQPLAYGASRNAYFAAVARASPPGRYPRYLTGERTPWTIVGVDGAREEALVGEDGAVEVGRGAFSLEPFLVEEQLVTWHDVARRVWLEDGYLPIPSVEWRGGDLVLTVTAFAVGTPDRSSLVVRYRVRNDGTRSRRPTLYVAARPFQVNPPWQFLGTPGGWARVDSAVWTGAALRLNADRVVLPLVPPARVAASTLAGGEIVQRLAAGRVPTTDAARDPAGSASAVLAWPLDLAPYDSADVAVEVPLVAGTPGLLPPGDADAVAHAFDTTAQFWRETVGQVAFVLPPAGDALLRSIRSNQAWILINRDGAAIQPGSRSYERSWIRDGALTSAALLRYGHPETVRAFIDWYARYQYPSGKIPCCVDARGADPVPEHDSNGEFIHVVMEYWRHTGDLVTLERLWLHVTRAVAYLDSLRQLRRTPEFRTAGQRVFFGLLPPSISHEGYSARPMHSYWDDFFALRGFKDATAMATVLGHADDAARFAALTAEFRADLLRSLDAAMERFGIDYLPGAADLGDFDPTSTTVALAPGGEEAALPRGALEATFERYWRQALARGDTAAAWESYTPYELRAVGAMLRLGWKDRALALLAALLRDQEPPSWNQWPEVVWRDRSAGRFIGDLPHTWVGSDFLRSAADLFAYERESDSALVVAAGIPAAWLAEPGTSVRGLSTWWGRLSFTARQDSGAVTIRIEAGLRVPPGGVVVTPPLAAGARAAFLDARLVPLDSAGTVTVRRLPAEVRFVY